MYLLYIYIYYIRLQNYLLDFLFVLNATRSGIKQEKEGKRCVFYLKARAIKSGETPQKSPILPPVHTFIKVLVTPLKLMFSYFYRISGGVKIVNFLTFDENCKKFTKNYKNYKKL